MNSIEQFFQKISQDPTLQQQLQSQENREAKLNKVVELGQDKGYNFTQTEVEEWLKSRRQELSESELEGVAGGQNIPYFGGRIPELDTVFLGGGDENNSF